MNDDQSDLSQTSAALSPTGPSPTGPERGQEILRFRASLLRIPAEVVASPDSQIEVIGFTLSGERYAMETSAVGEVIPADSWTALPGTPDFILGATNYRGEIVPIVDLRPLFGFSSPLPGDSARTGARIILLDDGLSPLGIFAETVTGVEILDRSEIHSMPSTIGTARPGYILGMAPGHCAILDSVAIRGDRTLFV